MTTTVAGGLAVGALTKTFPGQRALDGVHLTLAPGRVHGLLGHNGSGKSTLVKILAGVYEPDPGATLEIAGEPVTLPYAGGRPDRRLHFLHQDLGLVGSLSGLENLALGRGFHTTRTGRIDWSRERRLAREQLVRFDPDIDVDRPVEQLTVAQRTVIAIVRALQDWGDGWGLLVLDEPTASLPPEEAARLYRAVREVTASGASVLLITHHLDEVLQLCDSVTVLRDGRVVDERDAAALDKESLIEAIVGAPLEAGPAQASGATGEPVLACSALAGTSLSELSFTLRAGEVLGVAGVTGSGREEILPLVAGETSRSGGAVQVFGTTVRGRGPAATVRAGIGHVPVDRLRKGGVGTASVRENLVLPALRPLTRPWWQGRGVRRAAERGDVAGWLDRVDVRPRDTEAVFGRLSGGNQQKVVIARWLRAGPRVLMLDEPTQGVDVGAKAQIHDLLRGAARDGMGILVASSDLEELSEVCDRVIVLREGRPTAELTAPLDPTALSRATLGSAAVPPPPASPHSPHSSDTRRTS